MNQSVQILDSYQWSEQGLKIQAMVNGFLLDCFVSDVKKDEAEAIYTEYQFDLEEAITLAIKQSDGQGDIDISFKNIKDIG
ncbi:DUF1488 family protein [uncultured Shewanella sp.]|uniref:DUF1488 family protein n=1 Tax=uncultured Shewanella sp. TaxID=173975 RepID=UPI002632C7C3|nr:DUF1488 family protein [uncultured Shewanella sp.]